MPDDPSPPDPPDVVVVGAASRDLAVDDPRGWRLGGGVSYSSLTVARLGLRVGALVGVDGAAADAHELDRLREAGVELQLVTLASGPVFDNIERPEGRVQVAHASSDPIAPGQLPPGWAASRAWILAPVAGELPEDWAEVPSSESIVAVGWQGLLREVIAGRQVRPVAPRASRLIGRADLVGVSRDDLPADHELGALTGLLRPGATLLVTAGVDGGLAVEAGPEGPRRLRRYPAVTPDRWVDPTGAGDVFLASVLAARADPRLVGGRLGQHHDLLVAAAVASLVVEGPGLDGVPDRTQVTERVAQARARTAVG